MAVSGTFGRKNIKNLKVELIPLEYVFAKKNALFKIKFINRKKYPSFLLKLSINDKTVIIPTLQKEKDITVNLLFPKRGVVSYVNLKISSPFPFGFFHYIKKISLPINIVIFPKPEPYRRPNSSEGKEKNFPNSRKIKTGTEEFEKIREYINGDEIKKIHWKLSAKQEKLVVKDFRGENKKPPAIIDFNEIEGSLEKKLSRATFLILYYFKKQTPVGLKIAKTFFKPTLSKRKRYEMLKTLALYGEK